MHFILFYDVVDDYVTKRAPLRDEHLALGQAALERGELVLGGALMEPADQALLVFSTQQSAEAFVRADPYVKNGLVKQWRVRTWNTVIGSQSLLRGG
jgi:uncharacterized protein